MTSIEEADSWIGQTAVDNTGEQIGLISQIWVDDASGQAEWASVKGSVLRGREVLIPLAGTTAYGGSRRFAYAKKVIFAAPPGGEGGRLEVEDKEQLSSHYGAPDTAAGSANWVDRAGDAADGANVREIRALLGDAHSAPPAAVDRKASRRFGRKAAPSEPSAPSEPKEKRRLRRKASPVDQQPAELPVQHDEVFADH